MEFLLTVIVLWLSSNFDLPADMRHPNIELVPRHELSHRRQLEGAIERDHSAQVKQIISADSSPSVEDLEAIYVDQTRTIYLPLGWTEKSPSDISVLVHEMVHHLQRSKGERYSCLREREKLAYHAQDKWLAQFGRSLTLEFALDPFTVLTRTLCN